MLLTVWDLDQRLRLRDRLLTLLQVHVQTDELFGNVVNRKITNPYRTSHFEVILQVINNISLTI